MDTSTFFTDFCPYKLGIIDTVAQMLLPNFKTAFETQGVKTDLYKLNIYAAPSGKFKPHVDTPRGRTQFGSLVVALPCKHSGGQLVVRHRGDETKFDWGSADSGDGTAQIKWAAFYSDCEHEVLEVTSAFDISTLPLYGKVKAALAEPDFMTRGGHLGVYCAHAYAHSTSEGAHALPGVLKGSDMAVYRVFRALGLKVRVRPVLERLSDDELDSSDPYHETPWDYVGELGHIAMTDMDEEEGVLYLCDDYSREQLYVVWLTNPLHENVGFIHLRYGNQHEAAMRYTYAALIIEVPEAAKRNEVCQISQTCRIPHRPRRFSMGDSTCT